MRQRTTKTKTTSPDSVQVSEETTVEPMSPKEGWFKRRRLIFVLGGLLGIVISYLAASPEISSSLAQIDVESLSSEVYSMVSEMPVHLRNVNISEFWAPGRDWLLSGSTNFEVGREIAAQGFTKKDAIIIVPGIITSALESWSTEPSASHLFRKRIWASTGMIKTIVSSKDDWVRAMSLDPDTGIDPPGQRVRCAEGIDAAATFMPGFWVWQKVIENLGALNYDHLDMALFSYDWRLSYYNLEERDRYFSRLKDKIEFNLNVLGRKTALLGHSMGSTVVLYFLKWVESPQYGNGGDDWVERHVSNFVSIAGTLLGVPKAMSALLSGEMKDTVEVPAVAEYLLEKYFSRTERAKLFRSWAGSSSLLPKGGDAIWGDASGAPDDMPGSHISGRFLYSFAGDEGAPNLTMSASDAYLKDHVSSAFRKMLATNYSLGFERDVAQLKRNNDDHTKWSNPLEIQLPNAPSMSIYCLYGTGKETERAYFYKSAGREKDDVSSRNYALRADTMDADNTDDTPEEPPMTSRAAIDNTITIENLNASHVDRVKNGVVFNDGDGTVSILSLGAMCAKGWHMDQYNPGGVKIVTHELKHEPLSFDPRGGPTTADHVDVLGSSELNEAIMHIITGNGHLVKEVYHSRIKEIVKKIEW